MNIAEIHRYRLAAFHAESVDSITPFDNQSVNDAIAEAVAYIAATALIPRHERTQLADYKSLPQNYRSLVTGARIPRLLEETNNLLFLLDDVLLLEAGTRVGYYAEDSTRIVLDSIAKRFPEKFAQLVEQLLSGSEFLSLRNDRRRPQEGGDLISFQARWHDAKTADFRTCVQLLFFVIEKTWSERRQELDDLLNRLDADPLLTLERDEADRISWALTGATPLFRSSPEETGGLDGTLIQHVVDRWEAETESRVDQLSRFRGWMREYARNARIDQAPGMNIRLVRFAAGESDEEQDVEFEGPPAGRLRGGPRIGGRTQHPN